ncbi:MAG: hypothetical protein IJL26_03190 [Clostridia bacterium]|nr:hypothetical protein [Clostridia bacterium]
MKNKLRGTAFFLFLWTVLFLFCLRRGTREAAIPLLLGCLVCGSVLILSGHPVVCAAASVACAAIPGVFSPFYIFCSAPVLLFGAAFIAAGRGGAEKTTEYSGKNKILFFVLLGLSAALAVSAAVAGFRSGYPFVSGVASFRKALPAFLLSLAFPAVLLCLFRKKEKQNGKKNRPGKKTAPSGPPAYFIAAAIPIFACVLFCDIKCCPQAGVCDTAVLAPFLTVLTVGMTGDNLVSHFLFQQKAPAGERKE